MGDQDFLSRLVLLNHRKMENRFLSLTKPSPDETSQGEIIHRMRVTGKRLRSFLQLARPILGKKEARTRSRKLSQALKPLSKSRNALVFRKLIKKLEVTHKETGLSGSKFRCSEIDLSSPPILKAGTALEKTRTFLHGLIPDLKAEPLRQALRRSQENTLKARRRAKGLDSGTALHEWRKSLKQLFYQLEWVARAEDNDLKKELARLTEMEDRLGKIHDLDELMTLIKKSHSGSGQKRVLHKIKKRQKKQKRHLRKLD